MCIAYFSLGNSEWPLFIAANRDEFHQRPSQTAAPWQQDPNVIAGRDVQGGGTWLGINRQGRFAFLTNYREPGKNLPQAPSRGHLVSDFLLGTLPAKAYIDKVIDKALAYNGFNLVVGDTQQAYYFSNRHNPCQEQASRLEQGCHVLSNHLLNTPWPKAQRLCHAFASLKLNSPVFPLNEAFSLLRDTSPADDHTLPQTGLSLERERLLSSPFIISPNYGTRCSTIIAIHKSGRALLSETSFNEQGQITERHDWPFQLS